MAVGMYSGLTLLYCQVIIVATIVVVADSVRYDYEVAV